MCHIRHIILSCSLYALPMGDTRTTLGKQIRKLRVQMGLTQQQLAFMAGVSREQVCRLENGTSNPSLGQLDKVLEGLGCPIDKLFDEESWKAMGLVFATPAEYQEKYNINYWVM